jgi:hypothetical protein
MNKLKNLFEHSKWRETLIAIVSAFLGVFAGPIVEQIASPLFQPSYLAVITFIFISLLFLIATTLSLSMWKTTVGQITSTEAYVRKLSDSVGQKVHIVRYSEGYKELARLVQQAKSEVLIFTNYVFLGSDQKPIYEPERLNSSERQTVYDVTIAKLKNEKNQNKNFRFVRIIQLSEGQTLQDTSKYDPTFFNSCKFLTEMSCSKPEFASLRISNIGFQNTFVVIDKKFLYIEFEISKPTQQTSFIPYVMFVEDPNSEIVREMIKLYQRIEANSTLVTHL